MATLFYQVNNIHNGYKGAVRELNPKADFGEFVRFMQDVNKVDSCVKYTWHLDYGVTEYHKEQARLAKLNSGSVYYVIAEMDCDLMESTYCREYANELEAEQALNRIMDNAEGPVSYTQVEKEELDDFKAYQLDRAAQQAGY